MRGMGMGFFFGRQRRNDPVQLADPHPIKDYGDDYTTGNAGRDGYTVLSKANPSAQGAAPPVAGSLGPVYQGPDNSWEQ